MAYLIGVVLAFGVSGIATLVRLDRDRAFYPTVLIVIASYYALFAVTGGSDHALGVEMAVIRASRGRTWQLVFSMLPSSAKAPKD